MPTPSNQGSEPALDESSLPQEVVELNEMAWQLVDPDRKLFGREAEGLALARLAISKTPAAQPALTLRIPVAPARPAIGAMAVAQRLPRTPKTSNGLLMSTTLAPLTYVLDRG